VEVIAMTRLGYSQREAWHMYLGEFSDKFRIYKELFNLEKVSTYQIEPEKLDSLKDF
jgi:hypothetical protein